MREATRVIRIIVTGGTFDKEYNELAGELFFRDTHIPEMLAIGRSDLPVRVEKLMMLDSLHMTDDHRSTILKACTDCTESKVIITHGTDTMEDTAKTLGAAQLNKAIVLTGAMIPYRFANSDGPFNLGASIGFVQSLPIGVYITMNGRCFPWNRVRKNRQTGRFESIP